MTGSEFLGQPVAWARTGDAEIPYRAERAGRVLTVLVGDFPAEAMYTLLVDGAAVADFDDWPTGWVRPPEPDDLPTARTNAEARLFLQLQPCPRCGERRSRFRSSVGTVGDVLVSRYTGECPRCGRQRVHQFGLPAEIDAPPAGSVRFGGDEPSQLLDPGVWLRYSDTAARQVRADGEDEQAVRVARHTLATAIAAIDEVLKFVPPGADSVPASAFTSPDGRAVYDDEPRRFTRLRLAAVRDHYAERLAGFPRVTE